MADAGDGIDAAPGAWTFRSEGVARAFEAHVAASVPEYAALQQRVAGLATFFATPGSSVVDLGCATGRTLREIAAACPGRRLRLIGLDESSEMIAQARRAAEGAEAVIEFAVDDACEFRLPPDTSLVLAVYAFQFIPVAARRALIERLGAELRSGSHVVVVEKIVPERPDLVGPFTDLHLGLKLAAGHEPASIFAKAASLRGVMRPVRPSLTESWLTAAGFEVERFWQDLCFVGWVAERR